MTRIFILQVSSCSNHSFSFVCLLFFFSSVKLFTASSWSLMASQCSSSSFNSQRDDEDHSYFSNDGLDPLFPSPSFSKSPKSKEFRLKRCFISSSDDSVTEVDASAVPDTSSKSSFSHRELPKPADVPENLEVSKDHESKTCSGEAHVSSENVTGSEHVADVATTSRRAKRLASIKLCRRELGPLGIKKLAGIPMDIVIQFLGDLEGGGCWPLPANSPPKAFVATVGQLQAGLMLPLPPLFVEFFNYYNVAPGQLTGSVFTLLRAIIRVNTLFPGSINLTAIRSQYYLKVNQKTKYSPADSKYETYFLCRRLKRLGLVHKNFESDSDWPLIPIVISGNIYGTKDNADPKVPLKCYKTVPSKGMLLSCFIYLLPAYFFICFLF